MCTPDDAFRRFMGIEIEVRAAGNRVLREEDQDPKPARSLVNTKRVILLQTTLLVASVLVVEVGLQLLSRSSRAIDRLLAPPWEVNKVLIDDERLIYRGNPMHPEHDQAGYRNARRPPKVDIAILGDSQAYGPADGSAAWPRVLAQEMGRMVYNMALPGYGPAQSLYQLDDALSLAPRFIVVAPYFGNDLYDCFDLALHHVLLLEPISLALREAATLRQRERPLKSELLQQYRLFAEVPHQDAAGDPPAAYQRLKLYGLARAVNYRLRSQEAGNPLLSNRFSVAAAAISPAQRGIVQPFDEADWRTLLTPSYRGRALDDRDPRIRIGFEVMRNALVTMAARTRAKGGTLLVMLTPTKENVFWPRIQNPDAYPGLRQLIADENRLRRELISTLEDRGIAYLDVLNVLRSAPAQPYFENVDGHPNELGHRVIATAAAKSLGELSRK